MMNIIETRRLLHQHPELGYDELWTSDFIADNLAAFGYEVTRGIAKTGLVGILKGRAGTRGTIGYRAEMDALPIVEKTDVPFRSCNGCMHACGHDSHMAVALSVAERMARGDRLESDLAFVFQPNEEGAPGEIPSGADLMCQERVLERFDIRRMVALHSDPTLRAGLMGICRGAIWAASGRFVIRVHGRSAHAAYPERGRDALWGAAEIVTSIYSALSRRRPVRPEVVSICELRAGRAFNVIADEAEFDGIIRASSRSALDDIFSLISETASGVAGGCGVTATSELYHGADSVINDDAMVQTAQNVWDRLGCGVNVSMNMAAEDFAYFSGAIPTFYAMMGVKPADHDIPPSHSDNFTIDESALSVASDAMCALLYEVDKM